MLGLWKKKANTVAVAMLPSTLYATVNGSLDKTYLLQKQLGKKRKNGIARAGARTLDR